MLKVVKFGGSSLASAEQFARVKAIVEADPDRKVVVVSAPGKRFKEDNKVTDLLYICHAHIKYNASFDDVFEDIAERYRQIAAGCGLTQDLEAEFSALKASMNKAASVDYIVSRGEYLNAKLMAEYLGYTFIDSKDWLCFGYDGKVDFEKSYATLRKLFAHAKKAVLPGFYGALPDGDIKTFSRGGSDVTGAIAAAALDADAYENWTDVSGILMADPRIVDNPPPIEQVTFSELRELSYMGADVLHEETVFPVRQKNIPLYIKNTNDPSARGTLILEDFETESEEDNKRFVTGISGRKHYSIITVTKARMNSEPGYVRHTLKVVEKYGVTVEHITSSIDSFSMVVTTADVESCLHDMVEELHAALSPDRVKVDHGISLIAVVGRRMASNVGVSGRLFATLGQNDINIRMIEQGSDEINIIIGVQDKDFKKTIRVLYDSFT